MAKNYEPSLEDIRRAKVRTTGSLEYQYEVKDNYFKIVDVGGERNERTKWYYAFEGVSCVLFVASLKQYCEGMFEDESQLCCFR